MYWEHFSTEPYTHRTKCILLQWIKLCKVLHISKYAISQFLYAIRNTWQRLFIFSCFINWEQITTILINQMFYLKNVKLASCYFVKSLPKSARCIIRRRQNVFASIKTFKISYKRIGRSYTISLYSAQHSLILQNKCVFNPVQYITLNCAPLKMPSSSKKTLSEDQWNWYSVCLGSIDVSLKLVRSREAFWLCRILQWV